MKDQQPKYRRTYIREWRKFRGMTQEQFAAAMDDMAQSHVSMLENGSRGYTQATLERAAEALGTDVTSLLTRKPTESEDIWPLWDQATPTQRRQLSEIAKTIAGTRHSKGDDV